MGNIVIATNKLTKDYGNGKGIFDVTINVNKGEVFGFLGPNGAGKTTTIRNLLGFISADSGSCSIEGLDCRKKSYAIMEKLGYLAGEISFIDDMTGMQMINFMAAMKNVKDDARIKELIEIFELNPSGKIRKMSKGMKQKIGIICAFMGEPDVIILDEPTSGLDPLMQNRFVELILKEKSKGKTIFMSSHIFEEIEKTCDRAAIIKDGRIISVEDIASLKKRKHKTYEITFTNQDEACSFAKEVGAKVSDNIVTVKVHDNIDDVVKKISTYNIKDIDVKTESLEELFMHYYSDDNGGEING